MMPRLILLLNAESLENTVVSNQSSHFVRVFFADSFVRDGLSPASFRIFLAFSNRPGSGGFTPMPRELTMEIACSPGLRPPMLLRMSGRSTIPRSVSISFRHFSSLVISSPYTEVSNGPPLINQSMNSALLTLLLPPSLPRTNLASRPGYIMILSLSSLS